MTRSASPTGRRVRRSTAAAVVALVAVGAVACSSGGSNGAAVADDAEAVAVLPEPVGTDGPDPFTASVALAEVAELPAVVGAAIDAVRDDLSADAGRGVLVASGDTPGLYGGTRDDTACDRDALVDFLEDRPAEAGAWTGVLGIGADEVAAHVRSLTPVLLSLDTLVTNHGFVDGAAVPRPSVLQAGTAVLVDATGVPQVRCSCGNPLLPAGDAAADLDVDGDAWSGYDPAAVAVVEPAPPATELTVIDLADGSTYQEPVGAGDDPEVVEAEDLGLVLYPDGLGVVTFNESMDVVVDQMTDLLGPPDEEGEIGFDPLIGSFGQVRWSNLTLQFEGGVGRLFFVGYELAQPSELVEVGELYAVELGPWEPAPWEVELATVEGIRIGSSGAEAEAAYPTVHALRCDGPATPTTLTAGRDFVEPLYVEPEQRGLFVSAVLDDRVWSIGATLAPNPALCDGFDPEG